MSATGRIRGHLVNYDPDAELWRWAGTGEPAAGWSGGPERPCPACGLTANPDDGVGGADPCIGIIAGSKTACCGHGFEAGYIQPQGGAPVRVAVTVTPAGWPDDTVHTAHLDPS